MSSLFAIPAPTAIYREDQLFGGWVFGLLGSIVVASIAIASHPGGRQGQAAQAAVGLVGLVLPFLIGVTTLRMTTVVAAHRIEVWFGWIPTFRRAIDASSIVRVEVVTYRPMADYGGWGIRFCLDGERVYSARGNRGVRLHLADGSRILLGSQQPESLAASIDRSRLPRNLSRDQWVRMRSLAVTIHSSITLPPRTT